MKTEQDSFSLIGCTATVQTGYYEYRTGVVTHVREAEIEVDLGRGVSGTESYLVLTIVDKDGKEHKGQFPNISRGNMITRENLKETVNPLYNEYMVYDYETETANIICLQDFNDFDLFHEERKEIVNLSIGESFLLTDIGQMIAVITRVK